jgi:hypothetical protein
MLFKFANISTGRPGENILYLFELTRLPLMSKLEKIPRGNELKFCSI